MKISRNNLILVILAVLTTTLLSWNRFNPTPAVNRALENHYQLSGSEYEAWQAENDLDAFLAEDDEYRFSPDTKYKTPPAAEDVLVQKIPGDNSHVLMMAYYSKERYSGESVTLKQFGSEVNFTDDGRGYDKKAGDGLYTAKILADASEFRKLARAMDEGMRKSGKKQIRFEHRYMTYNSDELESFNFSKLDNNEPVSIASLAPTDISPIEDSVRKKCIYVTDLKVVEDPTRTWNPCTQTGNADGAWTFKTLMTQLAS